MKLSADRAIQRLSRGVAQLRGVVGRIGEELAACDDERVNGAATTSDDLQVDGAVAGHYLGKPSDESELPKDEAGWVVGPVVASLRCLPVGRGAASGRGRL